MAKENKAPAKPLKQATNPDINTDGNAEENSTNKKAVSIAKALERKGVEVETQDHELGGVYFKMKYKGNARILHLNENRFDEDGIVDYLFQAVDPTAEQSE